MQFVEPNTYIADEGKVFQRIFDGFNEIEPYGNFSNLTLGNILMDSDGFKLDSPIPDKIEYYKEVEYVTEDLEEPTSADN